MTTTLKVTLGELVLNWLDANEIEFLGEIDKDFEITLEFAKGELHGEYENITDFVNFYEDFVEGENN